MLSVFHRRRRGDASEDALPSQHDKLNQCWFNARPQSSMLTQQSISISWGIVLAAGANPPLTARFSANGGIYLIFTDSGTLLVYIW